MKGRGQSVRAGIRLVTGCFLILALGQLSRAQESPSTLSSENNTTAVAASEPGEQAPAVPTYASRTRAAGTQTPSRTIGTPAYRIGVDDVLTVTVWHEPDISRNVPVRPDGKISLPLVGEVQAAGSTTPELERVLRTSLAKFLKDPELTVMVAEIRSQRVNVMGQVMHPGAFSLTQSTGVLDAVALAGGLRDFAKSGGIYILREGPDGNRFRIKYDYKAVLQGRRGAKDITLVPNDTVVVP